MLFRLVEFDVKQLQFDHLESVSLFHQRKYFLYKKILSMSDITSSLYFIHIARRIYLASCARSIFLKRWLQSICMQLLRVTSTMSYQGSPYSGPGDEYDFEDDGYDDLDEYRDPEDSLPQPPMDDSDEGMICL